METVEAAKTADEATVIQFIREQGLVREHIPTSMLSSTNVSPPPILLCCGVLLCEYTHLYFIVCSADYM